MKMTYSLVVVDGSPGLREKLSLVVVPFLHCSDIGVSLHSKLAKLSVALNTDVLKLTKRNDP
jgi:hypothetical protein